MTNKLGRPKKINKIPAYEFTLSGTYQGGASGAMSYTGWKVITPKFNIVSKGQVIQILKYRYGKHSLAKFLGEGVQSILTIEGGDYPEEIESEFSFLEKDIASMNAEELQDLIVLKNLQVPSLDQNKPLPLMRLLTYKEYVAKVLRGDASSITSLEDKEPIYPTNKPKKVELEEERSAFKKMASLKEGEFPSMTKNPSKDIPK